MKIGILTYVRSPNYGAVLQAMALRTVIADMGHDVSLIDYFPDYHKKMYIIESVPKRLIFTHPKTFLRQFLNMACKRIRKWKFEKFQSKYIEPYCSSVMDSYDVVVYGSDQIWRKQPFIDVYNPMYFGAGKIIAQKNISYAASSDRAPISEEEKSKFSELLTHLDKISVRESWLNEKVKELGFESEIVLDPTLLLSATEWNRIINIPVVRNKRYLLYYDLLPGSFDEEEVANFAKKLQLKVIKIVGVAYFSRCSNVKTMADPSEFLGLIKNADFVLTSSFHGLVFSIIFHKNFFASFSHNGDRAKALLEDLNLEKKLLTPMTVIPSLEKIDYSVIDEKMREKRTCSFNFLHDCLK